GQVPEPLAHRRRPPWVGAEQLDAAARRPDEVEQQPDRRRLPRAVGAEEAEHLACADREVEVGHPAVAAVELRQALDADDGRGRHAAKYVAPIGVAADAVHERRAHHGGEPQERRRAAMKKILIATDGSPAALEALEFGLDLAAEEEAEALVVHVVPSIDSVPSGGFGVPSGAIVHEITEDDRLPLERAVELAALKGLSITPEILGGPAG